MKLNPDKEHVRLIREGLAANGGYSPCALVKNADIKCMCKEFRKMKGGYCHCGLYYKE